MILRAIESKDLNLLRIERNIDIDNLRTPYMNTELQQSQFYQLISQPNFNGRFYAIDVESRLVGYTAIYPIQFENGFGEITIHIFEGERKKGYGTEAVHRIIGEAFNRLRLENVNVEIYLHDESNVKFWKEMIKKYNAKETILPSRKFVNGKYWDSIYILINRKDYK